jgi:hypothetical protein
LRGNGQVTVGGTVPEAVMMAIYLEEAEILFGAFANRHTDSFDIGRVEAATNRSSTQSIWYGLGVF